MIWCIPRYFVTYLLVLSIYFVLCTRKFTCQKVDDLAGVITPDFIIR